MGAIDTERRNALADFLRSRRERLVPGDVGLIAGPRRRTPGLRREEVATLSGVSVSWYSWLEQGRDIVVSRQVLDALSEALRLTAAERRHLFQLAGASGEPERAPVADGCPAVGDHLHATIAALYPNPACLVDRHWDVLACNAAEEVLFPALTQAPPERKNMIWLHFGWEPMRRLVKDWETQATAVLAQFRASADRHPQDPRFAEIVEDLAAEDPGFLQRWERHDVGGFTPALKRFDHPVLGLLTFRQAKLIAAEDPELHLVVRHPADPATRKAFRGDA